MALSTNVRLNERNSGEHRNGLNDQQQMHENGNIDQDMDNARIEMPKSQGGPDVNFLNHHTPNALTMNNLMPYVIVNTLYNDDEDDELDLMEGRESNQTYASKRPSLYQKLEDRRQRLYSHHS